MYVDSSVSVIINLIPRLFHHLVLINVSNHKVDGEKQASSLLPVARYTSEKCFASVAAGIVAERMLPPTQLLL